jgi:hypothetical protein
MIIDAPCKCVPRRMANVSGAVQIETGIKHGLSIPFQSVAGEQSIDVGTLLVAMDRLIGRYPQFLNGKLNCIVAGLASSTLLTVLVIPAIYKAGAASTDDQ